jgi:hypothetical protein
VQGTPTRRVKSRTHRGSTSKPPETTEFASEIAHPGISHAEADCATTHPREPAEISELFFVGYLCEIHATARWKGERKLNSAQRCQKIGQGRFGADAGMWRWSGRAPTMLIRKGRTSFESTVRPAGYPFAWNSNAVGALGLTIRGLPVLLVKVSECLRAP